MTYSEMTDDQRLEWGREELAARKADLSLRTAEGLRDAKQRADARRRAIGASKSAAASMVAEATRELRWAAYRTTASQPDAGRAYHETHEPPHCPTCECGADNAAAQPAAAPCGHIWVYSTSVRDWECTKCGRRGRTADNSPAGQEG